MISEHARTVLHVEIDVIWALTAHQQMNKRAVYIGLILTCSATNLIGNLTFQTFHHHCYFLLSPLGFQSG